MLDGPNFSCPVGLVTFNGGLKSKGSVTKKIPGKHADMVKSRGIQISD